MAELFLSDGSEFSKIPLLTETITTDTNLDNHSKTGYYVVRGVPSTGDNASSPVNQWASVFTDADIGTPFQIAIPDGASPYLYKRALSSNTWKKIAAGDTIPVPNSTVSNKCVSCDGKNITINNSGLYQIVANFTFAATAEGPIETQMYRNGNALPAAHAIDTGAAASNLVSQAFSALVTVPCNAPQATINVKALSATSVRIANIIVVKIA